MTIKERLAELERQHKALDHEIAEALGRSSIDDLKIKELKRRKLMLKDDIERLRTIMHCENASRAPIDLASVGKQARKHDVRRGN